MELASTCFEAYRSFTGSHPWISSIATAEATFIAGDSVSQLMKDKRIDAKKIKYTAALAPVYGICLNGLMESGELVGKYILDAPIAKAALGPNLIGNAVNALFFANNTTGERNGYSVSGLARNYYDILADNTRTISSRIKENFVDNIPGKEFTKSVIGTLTFWNLFQYLNYSYVEESMRTPATLAAAFGWTILLSAWSLTGRRRKVQELESLLGQ